MTSEAETLMLDAAEKLAATEGLGAMSLRAVQTAAGQRNKSAAHYHFGSRSGLIERVMARRMAPINERRAKLLAALPPTPTTAEVIEVLVRPTAEAVTSPPESYWARFVLACVSDPTLAAVVGQRLEGEAFRQAAKLVLESLDHLPEPVRQRRFDQALGLVFLALGQFEWRSVGLLAVEEGMEAEELIRDLIGVCVAVLAAPLSSA